MPQRISRQENARIPGEKDAGVVERKLSVVGLGLHLGELFAGDHAEGEGVDHGHGTQTRGTVYAAGHFTACVQTLDRSVGRGADYLSVVVDHHAAHGVVRGGSHQADAQRGVLQIIGIHVVAAVLVHNVVNKLVVVSVVVNLPLTL